MRRSAVSLVAVGALCSMAAVASPAAASTGSAASIRLTATPSRASAHAGAGSAGPRAAVPPAPPPGPAGPPAVLVARSGDRQATRPGAAFADPLIVAVTDRSRRPVPRVEVTFTIVGGDARFATSTTAVSRTDRDGLASSPTLVAGHQIGTFSVTARVHGIHGSVHFAATATNVGAEVLGRDGNLWGDGLPDLPVSQPSGDGTAAVLFAAAGALVVSVHGHIQAFGRGAPIPDLHPRAGDPVVGAAVASSGRGVWAITREGQVLTSGSAPAMRLPKGSPIVAAAGDRSGRFVWVVRADGTVSETATASGVTSARGRALSEPRHVAVTDDGNGLLMLGRDGRVSAAGDAIAATIASDRAATAIASAPGGGGYYLLDGTGQIKAFGRAQALTALSLPPGDVTEGIWVAPLARPTPGAAPLPPTTRVLTASDLQSAWFSRPGVLNLPAAAATGIRPGFVVAADPSAVLPSGGILRVIAVTTEGPDTSLWTTPASLRDAAPDFSVAIGGPLSLDKSTVPKLKDGRPAARQVTGQRAASTRGTSDPTFNLGPFTAYLCSGGLSTSSCSGQTFATFTAGASVTLSPILSLSCNLLLQCQAQAGGSVSEQAEAKAVFSYKASYSGSTTLATIPFDTFPLDIGPFVVTVQPQLEFDLNVGASITATATFDVTQSASASAGVQYNNGSIGPFSSFTWNPPSETVSAGVQADAYAELEPKLNFEIDALAGAYVAVGGKLDLSVDTSKTPWWVLQAEISVHVGLDLTKIFGSSANLDLTVYTQDFPIAQASGPPVQITSMAPPDPQPNQAYSYQMTATGGTSPYTWTMSPANVGGISLDPSTGVLSASSVSTGLLTFTVTATDSAGDFATETYELARSDSFVYKNVVLGTASGTGGYGAIAYYRLDDPSGSTAAAALAGTPGTYTSPSSTTYQVNGAIDGDPDYTVTFGSGANVTAPATALPAGANPRTVEVWVNSSGCCPHLIGYPGFDVSIVNHDGQDWVYVDNQNGGPVQFPAGSVDNGAWHLIDVAYDGTNAQAYLDGQPLGPPQPLAINSVVPSGSLLTVGGSGASYDEAAVYPVALTPQIADLHWTAGGSRATAACASPYTSGYGAVVSADSPSLYYPLGDLGSDARDRVAMDGANGCNNAALPAGTQPELGAVAPYGGLAAVTLPGGAPMVSSSASLPQGTSTRTLETWFNAEIPCCGDFGFQPVIGYGGLTVGLMHYSSHTWVRTTFGANTVDIPYQSDSYSLTDGVWHLLDAEFGSGRVTIYVDGAGLGSAPLAYSTTAATNFDLGGLDGSFDQSAVYSTELSLKRISAHFAAGTSSTPCATPPASGYGAVIAGDAPSAYYRLGDLATHPYPGFNIMYDSSGNCINGSYTSAAAGTSPGALHGSSDDGAAALFGATASAPAKQLPQGSSSRTLETWFNAAIGCCGDFGFQPVLGYGGFEAGFVHYSSTEWVRVYNQAGTFVDIPYFAGTNFAFTDGQWHLLDVTYAAGVVTAYVDGASLGTAALAVTTASSAGPLNIGGLAGSYDEAVVYPAALSIARIDAHWTAGAGTGASCAAAPTDSYGASVLSDSPLVYWRLGDEVASASDRVAYDSSGHCLNGAYPSVTAPYAGTGLQKGGPGAVQLSGTVVSGSGGALPAGAAPRTLELWVNTQIGCCGDFGFQPLLGYGGFQVGLVHYSSTEWVRVYNEAGGFADIGYYPGTNFEFSDGNWHLLDVTYDGANVTVYVDGAPLGTAALALNTVATGSTLAVGWSGGVYAEAAVYPSALTAARIDAHWTEAGTVSSSTCLSAPATGYPGAVAADNPLVYWRLGDKTADQADRVAFDSSGHCLNGSYSDGSFGYSPGALQVGDDGAVSLGGTFVNGSASSLPAGSGARTVEVWINTSIGCCGDFGFQPLMSYGGFEVGLIHYSSTEWIRTYNELGTAADVGYYPGSNQTFTDGKWHLLDVTYDGANVTAYLDGASLGSAALAVNTTTTGAALTVGWTGGVYDEAAIYGAALTPARIDAHWSNGPTTSTTPCPSAATGGYAGQVVRDAPLVYWRLGDKVANQTDRVAFDSSGHCLNGAYGDGTSGYSPGALQVGDDGAAQISGNEVLASAASLPSGAGPRTLETWVNISIGCCGDFGFQPVMGYGGFNVGLVHYGSTEWVRTYNEAGGYVDIGYFPGTNFTFSDGAWHLLDVTYDGANVTVYLDGASIGEAALAVATPASATTLTLGQTGGLYDEAAVYGKAVSAARIDAHWTAAGSTTACATVPSGNSYPGQVAADGPTIYWRLGDKTANQTDRIAFDSSGHCHNGNYADGSIGYSPGALVSGDDGAIHLGGNTLTASGTFLPAKAQARALELWLNANIGCCGDFGFQPVIGYGGFDVGIVHYGSTEWVRVYNEAAGAVDLGYYPTSNRSFTDGHWHLLDVTYDGKNVTAYVDGTSLGSAALAVNTVASGSTLTVGWTGGVYDEAAVYPSSLSAARVSAHWKAGDFAQLAPTPPLSVTATPGSSAGTITVSWAAPASAGSSPITAYRIYRKTTGLYRLIKTVSATTTTFADTGLTSGTKYTFVVTALSSIGESAYSLPASATAP